MASRKSQPLPFERRTLVVWSCLIASLSAVSGLLMALGPTPHAPAVGPVLTVLDPTPRGIESLLATETALEPGRWKAIVIRHSGQPHGNAETLGQEHQDQGFGGLGYHFVVGNGDGADDGEIQAGYRWARQADGLPATSSDASGWFKHHTISICLVGNGDRSAPSQAQVDQLLRLVHFLQRRLGIPAERVHLQRDIEPSTTSPGVLFPAAGFREQLLDVEVAVSR